MDPRPDLRPGSDAPCWVLRDVTSPRDRRGGSAGECMRHEHSPTDGKVSIEAHVVTSSHNSTFLNFVEAPKGKKKVPQRDGFFCKETVQLLVATSHKSVFICLRKKYNFFTWRNEHFWTENGTLWHWLITRWHNASPINKLLCQNLHKMLPFLTPHYLDTDKWHSIMVF